MSDLENGMITIIKVFHKYSGHKCKLKKAELKELINNEMSQFIKVCYGAKYQHVYGMCNAYNACYMCTLKQQYATVKMCIIGY